MTEPIRLRREPPPFRVAEVVGVGDLSPHMRRITIAGPELVGFAVTDPAASVRWLPARAGRMEIPTWNGNEFLHTDGSRPPIRTLTPLDVDPVDGRLVLDVVLHDEGPLSDWARTVTIGTPVALSGPGRGYPIDPAVDRYLFAGDETAIPAICQLLEHMPDHASVAVHVELARPDARLELPRHPGGEVAWHDLPTGGAVGDALLTAIAAATISDGTQVWVAGEASAVHRIRRHLFEERGLPRSQATVRGYWKHGRGESPTG